MLYRVVALLLLIFSVCTIQEAIEELDDEPLCGPAGWNMTCTGCNSMTLCMPSGSLDIFCTEGTPYCVDGVDGFATCEEAPTAGCEPTTVETTTESLTTTTFESTESTTEGSTTVDTSTPLETSPTTSTTSTESTESTTEDSTTVDTTTPLETSPTTPTTSTENPTTPKPVTSMQCTGPGLFPDPHDCNVYHYCFTKGDQSHALQCSEGSVFDYTSQSCKELSSPSDCLTIQCDPLKVFQEYDATGRYFGVCSLGTIAVYRCPTTTGDAGSCPFTCTKEGFFTNSLDPNTYFYCWRMYGAQSLSMRMMYCPARWEFDDKVQRCVFKKDL